MVKNIKRFKKSKCSFL